MDLPPQRPSFSVPQPQTLVAVLPLGTSKVANGSFIPPPSRMANTLPSKGASGNLPEGVDPLRKTLSFRASAPTPYT
jgi:hypothetical protein